MVRTTVFIIIVSFLSPLFALNLGLQQVASKGYAIKLGVYKKLENAKIVENKFIDEQTYIEKKDGKYGIRHHLYIVNFLSKDEAKKKLKEIKKEINDAFVLLKRVKKDVKVKKIPKIKVAPIVSIPTIEQINNEANLTKPKPIKEKIIVKKPEKPITGLTLKEALLKALNKSNKISSAKEKVVQAQRKLDQKKAGYKPRVILYATGGQSYQHIRGEDGLEHNYANGSAELSLTQNIYSGGKVSNSIKKEEENLKVATYKFRSLLEEEMINIIDSYLSIIYEEKSIYKNRENMKSLHKILDIVTIKEENGASTKGDLNYIKSNVENASSALIKAESKYQNAISYYEYFVGNINENNFPIQEDFNFTLNDKNNTLLTMQMHNAKIGSIKAQIEAQRYDLNVKKAPFKPNLDLILSAKQKRTKSENEPNEDRANAVLSLSYNLYNGGKDKAALLLAKSQIAELKYKLIDLKESTIFNTIQMHDNLSSSKNSLAHIQKEVKANKKVTASYWNAFKYKEQDIQALLLAQRALNRSELDEIKEKKNYILGYYKLLAQTGELLEKVGLENFANPDKIIRD